MSDWEEGTVLRWLPEARAGSSEALGRLLEACRRYLLLVAERELDPALRPKGGASDLVQETFLDARRGFDRFQGESEAEVLAWLRRLLLNNLVSFTRLYRQTAKRQAGREVGPSFGGSSFLGLDDLAGEAPTPSGRFMAEEQAESIRRALDRLPEDYRRLLLLRYRDGRSFEEIGREMGRTGNAIRKTWLRAIERLKQEVADPP
jgi:RNA polymerase sigma-70 factor (ECF subfamily)